MTIHGRDMGTYIVQYGTAAERAALVTADVQPLTEFHETDTGLEYKWFGSWIAKTAIPFGSIQVANFPTSQQLSTAAMGARGLVQQITAYGTARVSLEPGSLFNDTFESALDTTNRWTASGTVPPTSTGGTLSLNAGTTNSATSILTSQPTFAPTSGFLLAGATCTFDAAKVASANSNYTFGFATCAAPTAAAPIDNGYVWERDSSGELCCCVYVSGTRYVINSTNPALITPQASLPGGATGGASTSTFSNPLTWPAGNHVLLIAVRGDLCFWYLDSFDVPVGVAQRFAPAVQTLPLRIAQINAAASVLATTNGFGALLVADSASQNQSISDPTYPWRRAVVGVDGIPALKTDQRGYAITQTVLTLTTVSQTLIAANANRKSIKWMVIGTADVTVSPASPVVFGVGQVYQAAGANKQGSSEDFNGAGPTNAFYFIGLATGSVVVVWEGA